MVLALALLGLGCSYDPAVAPGSVRCGTGRACPQGMTCVSGYDRGGEPLDVCCLGTNCGELRPSKDPADAGEPDAPKSNPGKDGAAAGADAGAGDRSVGAGDGAPSADGPLPPPPDGSVVVDGRAVDGMVSPDAPVDAPVDLAIDRLADTTAANGCPSGRGPDMVRVGTLCVDSTEVTNAQYKVFVAASGANSHKPTGECDWNTDLGPTGISKDIVGKLPNHPVTSVDWCDAYAFCVWAGKHLCKPDEFERGCSQDGTVTFPYGNVFNADACKTGKTEGDNDQQYEDLIHGVMTVTTCKGGGVFDMSGNVEEWVDSCKPSDNKRETPCLVAGGNVYGKEDSLSCDESYETKRNDRWVIRGFRCCAK